MHEPLPDGGMIRKLWISETDAYRDHLLRLDSESRHRRFSGAVDLHVGPFTLGLANPRFIHSAHVRNVQHSLHSACRRRKY